MVFFRLAPLLLQFLGQKLPKNCSNEEINPKNALAKYLSKMQFLAFAIFTQPMAYFSHHKRALKHQICWQTLKSFG